MKRCHSCKKLIALGGEAFGSEIFCSDKCKKKGLIAASDKYLTEDILQATIQDIHKGPCPKCGGDGPNDMQWHYTVWSAILLTSHKDVPEICCGKCGTKKKIKGFFFSGMFGWWGIPFGIIATPIQLVRNFIGLFLFPKEGKISKHLEEMVKMELGAQALLEK